MSLYSMYQEKDRKEKERATLMGRKSGVDAIVANMSVGFDEYISYLNNAVYYVADNLENGMKGTQHITNIVDLIDASKESTAIADTKVSSSRNYLVAESSRCQSEIDTLTAEISSLMRQIRDEEAAIEAARIAAEAEAERQRLALLEKGGTKNV